MPEARILTPRNLTPLQRWARPGSRHDWFVRIAKVILPVTIGILAVGLIAAPLIQSQEVSFVLAKDTVAIAKERMRVSQALYRGEDSKGQPFSIEAGSAVQVSSKDPVVKMTDLKAQIQLSDGPATLAAGAGRYDMDREVVNVDGPIRFSAARGYQLTTQNVAIGLKTRRLVSGGAVTGQMPLGSFSAGRMTADLAARTVVLDGRAHLHIVQGAIR